jgi:putative FmdB family regulatory protein
MPTYEYVCTECGHDLEVVQSFKDDALTECPNCHGKLRKLFGNVGVSFKGSGFYKTDSRGKSATPPPSSSGDPKTSETKSSETKSTETSSKPAETKSTDSSSSPKAS